MATIKSYTSLEQSKKLAEILPIGSADMRIGNYVGKSGKVDGTNIHYYPKGESFGAPEIVDAWSLAALLAVLPSGKALVHDKESGEYKCICYNYDTAFYSNPIDACYELILKLHERKIL